MGLAAADPAAGDGAAAGRRRCRRLSAARNAGCGCGWRLQEAGAQMGRCTGEAAAAGALLLADGIQNVAWPGNMRKIDLGLDLVALGDGCERRPASSSPCASPAVVQKCARTLSASCSSMRTGMGLLLGDSRLRASTSRMALLLTSSSLARSLIRILLIRPYLPPEYPAKSSYQPHGVISALHIFQAMANALLTLTLAARRSLLLRRLLR